MLGADNVDDAKYPEGKNWDGWGGHMPFNTGKGAMLHIHTPIEDQVE